MFDPQRLLGQLMSSGFKKGKKSKRSENALSFLGSSTSSIGGALGGLPIKGAIGLGALGIGIAAFEHFMAQRQGGASTGHPAPAPPTPAPLPPPPPPAPNAAPPASSTGAEPSAAPPASSTVAEPVAANEPAADSAAALLLIRAMIAAAHADGLIDDEERRILLEQSSELGFDAQDRARLEAELMAPLSIEQLVAQTRVDQAEAVYAAALIAIDPDTDAERAFLADLARRLRLTDADLASIRARLGIDQD